MKRKFVIGSMVAVCILMLLPAVSAVESNVVNRSNRLDILKIRNIDQVELREKILNDNSLNTNIQTLLLFLVGISVFVAAIVYSYVSSMIGQP